MACYGVVGVFEDNSSEAPDPTEEGSSVTGKLNIAAIAYSKTLADIRSINMNMKSVLIYQ